MNPKTRMMMNKTNLRPLGQVAQSASRMTNFYGVYVQKPGPEVLASIRRETGILFRRSLKLWLRFKFTNYLKK
jgi:hypothetical protein